MEALRHSFQKNGDKIITTLTGQFKLLELSSPGTDGIKSSTNIDLLDSSKRLETTLDNIQGILSDSRLEELIEEQQKTIMTLQITLEEKIQSIQTRSPTNSYQVQNLQDNSPSPPQSMITAGHWASILLASLAGGIAGSTLGAQYTTKRPQRSQDEHTYKKDFHSISSQKDCFREAPKRISPTSDAPFPSTISYVSSEAWTCVSSLCSFQTLTYFRSVNVVIIGHCHYTTIIFVSTVVIDYAAIVRNIKIILGRLANLLVMSARQGRSR